MHQQGFKSFWLQVLDARDPLGTRSRHLEHHLKRDAKHKHMILLLNKCDLVSASSSLQTLILCRPPASNDQSYPIP